MSTLHEEVGKYQSNEEQGNGKDRVVAEKRAGAKVHAFENADGGFRLESRGRRDDLTDGFEDGGPAWHYVGTARGGIPVSTVLYRLKEKESVLGGLMDTSRFDTGVLRMNFR